MDILIFLGTLVAVLLGGFLVVKLILNKRSTDRQARQHVSVPSDSRLKQAHTGRPYLRHQTSMRKGNSDNTWKAGRAKDKDPDWQRSTFTATKIQSDAEIEQHNDKQEEDLAMPRVDCGPGEPGRARAVKRSGQGR